jgi:hypothetical protein
MAGVAVALYASWSLGRRQGFGLGRTSAIVELSANATGQKVNTPYDATALTATVSNVGTSGMTIATNPAISSLNTNGSSYNV